MLKVGSTYLSHYHSDDVGAYTGSVFFHVLSQHTSEYEVVYTRGSKWSERMDFCFTTVSVRNESVLDDDIWLGEFRGRKEVPLPKRKWVSNLFETTNCDETESYNNLFLLV